MKCNACVTEALRKAEIVFSLAHPGFLKRCEECQTTNNLHLPQCSLVAQQIQIAQDFIDVAREGVTLYVLNMGHMGFQPVPLCLQHILTAEASMPKAHP